MSENIEVKPWWQVQIVMYTHVHNLQYDNKETAEEIYSKICELIDLNSNFKLDGIESVEFEDLLGRHCFIVREIKATKILDINVYETFRIVKDQETKALEQSLTK